MQQQWQIGLIGLGLLGNAIADRLLSHSFNLRGYDLTLKQREQFASLNGLAENSADAVFQNSNVILLSLPTSAIAAEVLTSCESELTAGQIIIDTTTGNPEEMVALGNFLARFQVSYIEATVAGSSEQLRAGKASLFVGGDDEIVERVSPILNVLGNRFFHLGSVGSASKFKLVHNLVLGLHRAVLAEALSFAESLGFESRPVLEILKQTPAASAIMDRKGEKMLTRDWQAEAKLSQHLKDVELILLLAGQSHAATPLSSVHRDLLRKAVKLGLGEADNSAILEAYLNETGHRQAEVNSLRSS